MKYQKLVSLLLSVILLFLCGCNKNNKNNNTSQNTSGESEAKAAERVSILYSSKDTLDPYTCSTEQNSVFTQLIYDTLLILDNNCNINYRLAQSVSVSKKICSIVIRDAKFSDGSEVTAKDVVFSFNKAKKSAKSFAKSLGHATSASVTGDKSLSINLNRNDPDFANLLTFPIMKSGSDNLKDSDNRLLPPIGNGRYVFKPEDGKLVLNEQYYGSKSAIKEIIAVDCPDNESVDQAVRAGMIDLYYTDLSDNVIPKMNGKTADILQNNIVFIGFNPNNGILNKSYVRQGISSAINRREICTSAYFSKATPALGPFPSVWTKVSTYQNISAGPNVETAKKNLSLAGFEKSDKDGNILGSDNRPLSFSLLVNSNNACRVSAAGKIKDNLKASGININIVSVPFDQYTARLRSGNYDLYIGEIRIDLNMDLGQIVNTNSAGALLGQNVSAKPAEKKSDKANATTASSRAEFSKPAKTSSADASSAENSSQNVSNVSSEPVIDITLTSAEAYNGYYSDLYSLQDLTVAFTAELPVIPVCYKSGLVIYSEKFGKGLTPSLSDLFGGIEKLK